MFLHRVLSLVGACLLVGLLAALMGRHEQIRALEASLPTQSAAAEAVSLPVDAGRRAASVPLSDEEQRELLTLRRQVGEGRRGRAALDSLEARNRQLHAQLAGVTNGATSSPAGAAYLASRNARFAGTATPRDTLESFLAAARQGDTNVLFQVLDDVSGNGIRAALESQGTEKTFTGLRLMRGFRIRSLEEQADGSARVEVEFDPRTAATESLTFQRVNGEWRLSLRF